VSAIKRVLAAVLACSAAAPARAALPFKTRTVGSVTAACSGVGIFVPVPDTKIGSVPADNRRAYAFIAPGATDVYIAHIMDTKTNAVVEGKRVAVLDATGKKKIVLGRRFPLPFTLQLEGLKASAKKDDTGFEYQFYVGNTPMKCGGVGLGTIVKVTASLDVASGHGAVLGSKTPNVLVTAAGQADGALVPVVAAAPAWRYPDSGAQNASFANAAALTTAYTAGAVFTPAASQDQDEMILQLTAGGQVIEAFHAVNLTAPTAVQHDMNCSRPPRNPMSWTSGWLSANNNAGDFTLIDSALFCYHILDQFGGRIKKTTAWGALSPQIRENIRAVISSPIPVFNTWLANLPAPFFIANVNWTPVPSGDINDHAVLSRMPMTDITSQSPTGRKSFIPPVLVTGAPLIQLVNPPGRHIWQTTVDQTTVWDVTHNELFSVVDSTRQVGGGIETSFLTTYTIHTP